jgi:hypothetical protein
MKGEVRYAEACVDGFYTRDGDTPIFHSRFTDYRKLPTKILEVSSRDRERLEKLYKWSNPEYRSIWRREFTEPVRVLVIGQTYMRVGYRQWGGHEEGNYFGNTDQIVVYRVVPFPIGDSRYYKPFEALLVDLIADERQDS